MSNSRAKKVVRSAPKKALRTAGALKRTKAPKPVITRVDQPENYGFGIEIRRNARHGFRIASGCRNFTPAQAAAHWEKRAAEPRSGCTSDGQTGRGLCSVCDGKIIRARKMLKLLPLLAQRARRYGWKPARDTSEQSEGAIK